MWDHKPSIIDRMRNEASFPVGHANEFTSANFVKYTPDFVSVTTAFPNMNEPTRALDDMAWLYIIFCRRNYARRNVLKIGVARNVERHLCAHLSDEAEWDEAQSRKELMPIHEAYAEKKRLKEFLASDQISTRRSFKGRTDWYDITQKSTSLINANEFATICKSTYKKEHIRKKEFRKKYGKNYT